VKDLAKSISRPALTPAGYQRLLRGLRRVLEQGRLRAEQALAHHLVETYHAMGALLLAQNLPDHAGYGQATVRRLADDLGLGSALLYRAMALARAYPDGPPASGLRWAHYRELVAVTDADARAYYEREAAEQGWTATRLLQAIRAERYAKEAPVKSRKGRRRRKRRALKRPAHPLHVYKARVLRVVDADTLLVDVDLGFQVHKEQRVRLASVDCPEGRTPEGLEATAYVQDRLASVEFVVVATVKVDLYGRYVAHVFYLPGEKDKRLVAVDGRYLNQELVDRGLAEAV
jgi:micrococcal nuclease